MNHVLCSQAFFSMFMAMIRGIYQVFVLSAAILFIIFGIQLYTFTARFSEDEKKAVDQVHSQLENAEQKFSTRLKELMNITEELAIAIGNESLDSTQILQVFEQKLINNPDIFGLGVGFEPYEFNKSQRLFAPFFIRPNNQIELQFIESSYDYTTREWYSRPLKSGAAWFEPPYFGEVAQTMMAEYSVPIKKLQEDGSYKTIGIVFLDYALDDMTKAVASMDLGKSGYGMVFSQNGTIIAHPNRENVLSKKDLDHFINEWQSTEIKALFDSLVVNQQSYVEAINKKSGVASRIFLTKIDPSGWRLGAVFIEDEFKTDSDYINRVIILLTVAAVGGFMLIFLFYLFKFDFKGQAMKRLVPLMVSIFLLAIGIIWYSKIFQPYNIFQQSGSTPILELTGLQKFQANQDSLRSFYHEPPIINIPTGVYIKHIEFDGSHNVRIGGLIWQKYPANTDSIEVKPGLFFVSTAPDAEARSFEELYRKTDENGNLVIGWDFRLEVRLEMHYGLYPLDRERISLVIKHPDLSQNIQLIPDLLSYEKIIPTELPGIDPDIILPEWETEQSYFAFEATSHSSNFGVLSAANQEYKYELGYNVILKRKYLWPTMANIIPLATITILLFLALISTTQKAEEKKGVLFSGFGLLELCAAFLFVAILTHIDLRSNLIINYIMYMDYFYFHVYFTIIICSMAAVSFNKDIHRKKMSIVKLLYWPLLLGSLFVFTAIRFY
jgi:hypothetical protein